MKKQHRKCSGIDLMTFFDPVGAFPKSGGGPDFGSKSRIHLKMSLAGSEKLMGTARAHKGSGVFLSAPKLKN